MRHPFTVSLPPKATRPSFASPTPRTPAIVWKCSHLPESQRIVLLPQNPGDASYPKPPQDAPPDFEPSPQPTEKKNLTTPSLKQRHTRKTCATQWQAPAGSSTPRSGAAPLNAMLESVKTSANEEPNRDMTDFEVNSADYWESRFEGDWAQSQGCEQTRYFARILLDHLPSWLEDEIRTHSLSICDWGCAEGEAVDAFRTRFPQSRVRGIDRSHNALRKARHKFGTEYFIDHDVFAAPLPVTFDVLATSNVLQYFQAPWLVLRRLGVHTARHLLILVPFREENRTPGYLYSFDDATIGTHIDPDFTLSSCKVIDCHQDPAGCSPGSQILLVYSRPQYFPHSQATFGASAREIAAGISTVAGSDEASSRELGKAAALLESRGAELRELAGREAALHSDVEYWRTKAAALARQLEQNAAIEADRRAGLQRLEEEAAQLRAHAAENRILSSAADASSIEAANLRRLVTELQSSLSWRITAPLRFLTKPLFRALAPAPGPRPPAHSRFGEPDPRSLAPGPRPRERSEPSDPIETIILPELRRARSIAAIQCAIPFSPVLNQRPISYAKYLADRGSTVLFLEVWQCPEADIHRAGDEVYPRVFSIPFYPFHDKILNTFQENVDRIAAGSQVNRLYVCTMPSAELKDVLRPLRAAGYHIHYDIMDDWEEFHRGGEAHWYSASVERDMVVFADTVSAVSDRLAEKFRSLRPDVAVVRNGYQPSALACEQFIAARTPLERPKVVGYFGHFSDAWFDWDTVFYAAEKRPEIEFELIGYGLSERARVRMSGLPNIRFEGLVPQNNLHRYAKNWWAGMIPFRPSAVSIAVDPLKIYEYLHFGLPAVVTGISGIADFPMVRYAGDRESFVLALDQLPDRPSEQSLSETAEFLKACVWEARLAKLNSMMSQPAGSASPHAR
jgi:glycosyltransferase involved in cell wall biosynthesis